MWGALAEPAERLSSVLQSTQLPPGNAMFGKPPRLLNGLSAIIERLRALEKRRCANLIRRARRHDWRGAYFPMAPSCGGVGAERARIVFGGAQRSLRVFTFSLAARDVVTCTYDVPVHLPLASPETSEPLAMAPFRTALVYLVAALFPLSRAIHFANTQWSVHDNESFRLQWGYDESDPVTSKSSPAASGWRSVILLYRGAHHANPLIIYNGSPPFIAVDSLLLSMLGISRDEVAVLTATFHRDL
jgi:hypothetical protein